MVRLLLSEDDKAEADINSCEFFLVCIQYHLRISAAAPSLVTCALRQPYKRMNADVSAEDNS